MPRYFIEVSYKGTNYSGFQVQKNATTIQSEVEKALAIRLKQSLVLRVHHVQMREFMLCKIIFILMLRIIYLVLNENFNEEENSERILYSLNSILPEDIVIKKFQKSGDEAHCRFDAISREYKYFIYTVRKIHFIKTLLIFIHIKLMLENYKRQHQLF